MKIGDISHLTGVSQRMIRHFESLGLLRPERENTYRIYSKRDGEKITKIKELQKLGLSLKDIQDILKESHQNFETKLMSVLSRNRQMILNLENQNSEIVTSLRKFGLTSSLDELFKQGLIMKFVESFAEKDVVRGRMPYLETLYEQFIAQISKLNDKCVIKDLHSTDLMMVHEAVKEDLNLDLKILITSDEFQLRNSFVFFLSPELIKKMTGETLDQKNIENNKELNLQITSWVNLVLKEFNFSWNAIFSTINLSNLGMLKNNDDLGKLYHSDEIFLITNMNTGIEEERFSIGLPYRTVAIIYSLLKKDN
jgi:DNA-binding transcriptional MerR regulator